MKKVAVMIDGGWFTKIFKDAKKHSPNPEDVLKLAKKVADGADLFRIYYYDCPPYDKPLLNPINQQSFGSEAFIQANKMF